MELKPPRIIGHRGAKAYAPENTLASIHTAADMGVTWVEIDAKITKDGMPMIFHDDLLDRTTSGSGEFRNFTYDEIKDLDAGSWFSESFIDTKIPTLDDALITVIDRGLGLNLEIKPCKGREKETAEIVLDYATRIWPDDIPPPLISSFSAICLETAFDMVPHWHRGLLLNEGNDEDLPYLEEWAKLAEYLQVSSINCNGNHVNPEQLALYQATGLPILSYTINDPNKAIELIEMGVHGLFSDCPDVIEEALEDLLN